MFVAWDYDRVASRGDVGDRWCHVVWDVILWDHVPDVLAQCKCFGLCYELLDGGRVEKDVNVRKKAERVKF